MPRPRRLRRKKWIGGRALLNMPGEQSTAAIVAEIEDTSVWEKGRDGEGDTYQGWTPAASYTFQVSDCDRSISWELDFTTPEARKNNLHKIDTLMRVLSEFRSGVAVENREYERRQRATKPYSDDE